MKRSLIKIIVTLTTTLLAACSDSSSSPESGTNSSPNFRPMSIWTGDPFMSRDLQREVIIENDLIVKYLFRVDAEGEPEAGVWEEIDAARQANVQVQYAPLPSVNTYFSGSDAPRQITLLRGFVERFEERYNTRGVLVVDLEGVESFRAQFEVAAAVIDYRESGEFTLPSFLMERCNNPEYDTGRALWLQFIDELRLRGWEIQASYLAYSLDDLDDGDNDLSRLLDAPIFGLDFDLVSFQCYRTIINAVARAAGLEEPGAGYITSCTQDIIRHYGDKAAIDVGIVAGPDGVSLSFPDAPYASIEEYYEDMNNSLLGGIPLENIQLFSLGTLVEEPSITEWLTIPTSSTVSAIDQATIDWREIFQEADALIDIHIKGNSAEQ